MAKSCSQTFTFYYPWEKVAFAINNRYTTNSYSSHVISEDVISKEIKDNKLYIKKIIVKTSKIPKWAEKIIPARSVPILEECIIDPLNKIYVSSKQNIMHQKFMMAREYCTYTQDNVSPNITNCEKKAWVDSKIFGFATAIKRYGIEKYKSNSTKADIGLNLVLEKFNQIDVGGNNYSFDSQGKKQSWRQIFSKKYLSRKLLHAKNRINYAPQQNYKNHDTVIEKALTYIHTNLF
ncbi:unnamed protein product [Gordionus sp. m RMFG-2023]|uniref:PRELI domain-containing protein 1, mitochondrial-like n=1 Tax=Gordionus sp. m RMFG-2023 TaxID=3053472 RepID=UPI0030DE08E4